MKALVWLGVIAFCAGSYAVVIWLFVQVGERWMW